MIGFRGLTSMFQVQKYGGGGFDRGGPGRYSENGTPLSQLGVGTTVWLLCVVMPVNKHKQRAC